MAAAQREVVGAAAGSDEGVEEGVEEGVTASVEAELVSAEPLLRLRSAGGT